MAVDFCSTPGLKPFDEALDLILASIEPLSETESILVADSLDRILAVDILSNRQLPPWHCSAMDGYALKLSSLQSDTSLRMVGASFAGHPYEGKVGSGECIQIMTGACLPDDCDVVVMQENVSADGDEITFNFPSEVWQHVRKKGSEVKVGEKLLAKGQGVNPRNIGVIASLGYNKVCVYRKLKVAVFSTGDELAALGDELEPGQIFDSNRYAVIALCKRLGFEVLDFGLIEDDPKLIKAVMLKASSQADVLLTSGGVSVGEADYVKTLVEEIGTIDLWKVAMKPGKPIAVGSIKDCKFFGLPGNPVSALVTLNLLVQPAMQKLSGNQLTLPLKLKARCDSSLRKKPGRRDYQRGLAYLNENGAWHVSSTGIQGSAKITSVSTANCYIVLEENKGNISVGDNVTIQLFDQHLR
ncbi:MAG: molybdopterin molybdenumtransferase MoeA [Gammaproteobacteria bacterium]|nr:MAG: molybdopterin molybdenumtransferase MoeA [Gammaproteobacteria bacterium]